MPRGHDARHVPSPHGQVTTIFRPTSVTIDERSTHASVIAAGLLLAGLFVLYSLQLIPAGPLAAGAWTLTALLRTAAVWFAWRLTNDPQRKRAWGWLGVASFIDLAAQLYTDAGLTRGAPIPLVSIADIGLLGAYPAYFLATWNLLTTRPLRQPTTEILLDASLLTLTAVAWAYELFVEPLAVGAADVSVLASVAYATGGLALLWLIGMLLLRPNRFPSTGEGIAVVGIGVFAASDLLFGTVALPRNVPAGSMLDLGWDAANLILATAAVFAAARPDGRPAVQATGTSVAPRLFAVLIGFFGLVGLHIYSMLRGSFEPRDALLPLAGGIVIAARVGYSLFTDRRHEAALEQEVERQTQSLVQSLAATATAERNLRQIIEASPDPIVLIDRDGRVLEYQPDAPDRTPAPGAPRPTRSAFEQFDPDAAKIARQHLDAAFAGEVRRFEAPLRRPDGGRGVTSLVYAPIREQGQITKVLAIARDVTELRRAQTQLQQADKLAAMGQLVSGVAHEINNPAAIISGFAQTLMLDDLRPEQREIVEMVRDEAMRIGQITTNLLAFARMSGPERSLVDVNELVRRTFNLRAYHLNTLNVQVDLELDATEPRVWANVSELQQLLLNLLINAEQALETFEGPRRISLRTRAESHEVHIACRDSGPGVPAELRSRIFDPFFTTKPEGVGTGLGLSICYGIVKSHGGRIWLESEVGHGASFEIALPLDLRTAPRPIPGDVGDRVPDAEPLCVLVVDDEPGIRQATARFLNRCGIQVRAVSDGAEALRALRTREFDVILCDVRMPGMNGRDFLTRLREQAPRLVSTLIFATGDALDVDTAALLSDAGAPSLVKPFDFDALEQLVRDVAARTRGAGLDPETPGRT
jgi:signal transduction histidine kinase/CheY-like chemotaxis protein